MASTTSLTLTPWASLSVRDVGHRRPTRRPAPGGADRAVERRLRGPQDAPGSPRPCGRCRPWSTPLAASAGRRSGRCGRAGGCRAAGASASSCDVARLGAGGALLVGRRRRAAGRGVGLEVEQHGGQAGAGHAVEQAVVVLHHHADPAAGQALDVPASPTAGGAVELRRGAGCRPAHRAPAARRATAPRCGARAGGRRSRGRRPTRAGRGRGGPP